MVDNLLNPVSVGAKLRKNTPHVFDQHIHELIEKRFLEAEGATVADGAAQDAAEDVVAVVIAGLDSVGDGEAEGADVIGNDAESNVS